MNYQDLTVGEIVANDFRAAEIFKNAGIDFCCGGKINLLQACKDVGIQPDQIEQELKKLEDIPQSKDINFKEWNLEELCDYIISKHHKYILKTIPDLINYTAKLASVHGDRHPELKAIAIIFAELSRDLLVHLKSEEDVLFPAIKKLLKEKDSESRAVIIEEINRMSGEHEVAGSAMDRINVISNNYQVPSDGCGTYQVGFKILRQFEEDLHVHVHLENNILYPGILKLA